MIPVSISGRSRKQQTTQVVDLEFPLAMAKIIGCLTSPVQILKHPMWGYFHIFRLREQPETAQDQGVN